MGVGIRVYYIAQRALNRKADGFFCNRPKLSCYKGRLAVIPIMVTRCRNPSTEENKLFQKFSREFPINNFTKEMGVGIN